MKTLQAQYNLIKEGKGDKAYFMKLARYNFPDLITPILSYNDTITVLKNKSILSEGIGGVVTTGKKQDWHAIFNENMEKLKEKKDDEDEEEDDDDEKYKEMIKRYEEEEDAKHTLPNYRRSLKEAKKAKNEEEPSKEVLDNQKNNFDYKDTKNYDNVFGQEFLKGYYTEMKDPKNADKDVEELRAIVAKNLAKDMNYYVKDGQFGVKGLGYITDAPGLGIPKEAKGKHKSSGYGDLKESVLRSQIYLLVKEVLTEGIHDKDITSASHTNVKGKMGDYDPKARAANLASLANFDPKSTNNFSEYSDDAIADMIINLSRFKGNEEEIQMAKAELARRKSINEAKKDWADYQAEGYDACKAGKKKNNPYKSGTDEYKQWEKGWDEAITKTPLDEKKKPSAGLTKKEKSAISKKAHAGKDIGKKGKGFEKVAKAAEKQYGSKEAGEKVAAAAMWKSQAAKKG